MSGKELKMQPSQTTKTYEYHIDKHDRIEYVDSNWSDFALENAGEYLIPDSIVGTTIWRYLTDDTTVSIYQSVFERVRRVGTSIELPFRCDSPGIRRFMKLEVEPLDDGQIRFRSHLIREEPRTFIHALSAHFKRSNTFVTMCSWCKKVKLDENQWVEIERAIQELNLFQHNQIPMISHGICPSCFSRTWPKYH
jgi:hypothetical protein